MFGQFQKKNIELNNYNGLSKPNPDSSMPSKNGKVSMLTVPTQILQLQLKLCKINLFLESYKILDDDLFRLRLLYLNIT